jgi:hypothetical protein
MESDLQLDIASTDIPNNNNNNNNNDAGITPTSRNDTVQYICNMHPSPFDILDWSADSILSESKLVLPKLDLRHGIPHIKQQNTSLNISGAHAAAAMKEWQEYHNIQYTGDMSTSFIYNNRTDQDTTQMCGREIMKILKHHGCPRENEYPNTKVEGIQDIDSYVYKEANNFRIKAYARIYTIKTLKLSLMQNGPCVIIYPIFNGSERPWKARRAERQKGASAMLIVGYDDKGFIVRNSWGTEWGKQGYSTYTYQDWGSHFEIWTSLDDMTSQPIIELAKKKRMFHIRQPQWLKEIKQKYKLTTPFSSSYHPSSYSR